MECRRPAQRPPIRSSAIFSQIDREVAEQLGVTHPTISTWVKEHRPKLPAPRLAGHEKVERQSSAAAAPRSKQDHGKEASKYMK